MANQQRLIAEPGDAVFVTTGTVHGYPLNFHFTRFIGFLPATVVENFFRVLGGPWAEPVFPHLPSELHVERVMAKLDPLDLHLCGERPQR
ncbi:hypothetical protein [Rouxiella badensis]|uniref:hypothetical protein n=1 Tax=Rouxiella badensis TaxID=1646377 RepID=UPI003C66D962